MSRFSVTTDADAAVAGLPDGATVLLSGFGMAGMPVDLNDALIRQGGRDRTVVSNNAGNGDTGRAALLAAGRVARWPAPSPGRPTPGCSTGSTIIEVSRVVRAAALDPESVVTPSIFVNRVLDLSGSVRADEPASAPAQEEVS